MASKHLSGCSKRLSSMAAASEEAMPCSVLFIEPLSDARTKLADFFNILREGSTEKRRHVDGYRTKQSGL